MNESWLAESDPLTQKPFNPADWMPPVRAQGILRCGPATLEGLVFRGLIRSRPGRFGRILLLRADVLLIAKQRGVVA